MTHISPSEQEDGMVVNDPNFPGRSLMTDVDFESTATDTRKTFSYISNTCVYGLAKEKKALRGVVA